MRKVQLAAMLVGGTKICAIDEISSGLDPLSRRKIWDILLAERGKRTMILTTHYLDEADLLSDHILILSKGVLKCEGSAAELKDRYGGGYRVHSSDLSAPEMTGVTSHKSHDEVVYSTDTSRSAGEIAEILEERGIRDYHVNGPTIEDCFLKVTDDFASSHSTSIGSNKEGAEIQLYTGKHISWVKSAWILFLKRCIIFRRNAVPNLAATTIPIVAAAITMKYVTLA